MIEFAKGEFREENLAGTEPPEDLAYLWEWFSDLTDWRQQGFGVGPLSHLEIESWARLMGLSPTVSPFEAHVLRMLDRECRLAHHEKNEEKTPSIGESLRTIAAENAKKRETKKMPKKK